MKGAQKGGRNPETGVNVPWPQQAVDQGVFDDDDLELTPVKDMDKLEDITATNKIQHVVALVAPRSEQISHLSSPNTLRLHRQLNLVKYKSLCCPKDQYWVILLGGWQGGRKLITRRVT